MENEQTFTTAEAAEFAGATKKQIDDWSRTGAGVIQPKSYRDGGSGRYREWNLAEARTLLILRRLSDLRATAPVLKSAARVLVRDAPRVRDARWLVVSAKRAQIVSVRDLPGAWRDGSYCVPLRVEE